MRIRDWICGFMLNYKGGSDSCLWLGAPAWKDFWVFSLSFKGNSYLRVFYLNCFYWVFITPVFTYLQRMKMKKLTTKPRLIREGSIRWSIPWLNAWTSCCLYSCPTLRMSAVWTVTACSSQLWCSVLSIFHPDGKSLQNPCFEYEEKKV